MATIGEQRVRTTFNPSADGLVDKIKQQSAALIDVCETLRGPSEKGSSVPGEVQRLISLAQTSYEEAAMWAVKAATFGK